MHALFRFCLNIDSVCKKTHCVSKKRQDQGARSPKKRSVQCVLEHFWDERNADIDVFLETLDCEGLGSFSAPETYHGRPMHKCRPCSLTVAVSQNQNIFMTSYYYAFRLFVFGGFFCSIFDTLCSEYIIHISSYCFFSGLPKQ